MHISKLSVSQPSYTTVYHYIVLIQILVYVDFSVVFRENWVFQDYPATQDDKVQRYVNNHHGDACEDFSVWGQLK